MVNAGVFLSVTCIFFLAARICCTRGQPVIGCRAMTQAERRLSDKILAAFQQACDKGELDVAALLVQALELTLTRAGGKGNVDKREDLGPVVDAYARLKQLRERS